MKFTTTIPATTVKVRYAFVFHNSEFHELPNDLCLTAPEEGKGLVVATSDQRHLNALASDLITMQATDGTYGLSQV